MKLYYKAGACSLAVRILLQELHLPCDYVAVDLTTKKTADGSDFFAINPKGSVPVLELDTGLFLTENAAIQQYLADTHHAEHLLPAVNDIKRYQVLEWLNFVSTELHKSCGPFFNPLFTAEIKQDILTPLLKTKLDFLNKHLEKHSFLALNHYTIADIYCFVVLTWMKYIHISLDDWPAIADYYKHTMKREAVQKALSQEGLI